MFHRSLHINYSRIFVIICLLFYCSTNWSQIEGQMQQVAHAADSTVSTLDIDAAETVSDVRDNVGGAFQTLKKILSPVKLFTILVIILIAIFVGHLLRLFFNWSSIQFPRNRLRILRFRPILNFLLWFLTAYILLMAVINPSSEAIYAALASSAIALGFAAQDILKNVFGGLIIIIESPFQVGDRIQIGSDYGEVLSIGLRATRIHTLDDSIVTIPNEKIVSEGVSNANSGALDCMVVIDLYLPINVNVATVRKIAYEAAITSRFINYDKPVQILFFDQFDQNPATNVKIKAYVLDARYEKMFEGDVAETAKKAFNEFGIYSNF